MNAPESVYDAMLKKLYPDYDYEWVKSISEIKERILASIEKRLKDTYQITIQVTPDIELHIDFCLCGVNKNVFLSMYVYHTTYGQQRYYSLERLPVSMRLLVMQALYNFICNAKEEVEANKQAKNLAKVIIGLLDKEVIEHILREVMQDEQQREKDDQGA